jgi:hypothetical protein
MTAGSSAFYSIRAYAAAAIAGALLVSAPASAQGISDKLNDWFFGKPAPEQRPPGEAEELECPGVEVRQGASTLAINAPTGEATPMNARYQVSIGQLARECKALGGTMTMRIGVQGRILLGPAGGPGQVDIPLRIAIVQEGPEPKPILSKFTRLSISVQPGQTAVPFTHIEQDVTFPMPRPAVLEAYVVYVGFDPTGMPAKPTKQKQQKQQQQKQQQQKQNQTQKRQ